MLTSMEPTYVNFFILCKLNRCQLYKLLTDMEINLFSWYIKFNSSKTESFLASTPGSTTRDRGDQNVQVIITLTKNKL